MAVVETLEVRFQADMSRLSGQLTQLAAQIGGISDALEDGQAGMAVRAMGMIRSIGETLRSGAAMNGMPGEAGGLMAKNFGNGIALGAGDALLAAQRVCMAAQFSNEGALDAARSAGANLAQGFAGGIASKYGAVMSAVNRIVSAAVSRIRNALKIHSPSKVSFELGGYFGEGFAEGIYASVRMAQRSASALSLGTAAVVKPAVNSAVPATDAGGFANSVQAAVQEVLGGTNIVIPLHVDGMKLGEASIRGINRVTRSTGRMMLEI